MDLKSWNCYLEELVGAVERRKPVDPSQDPQFIDVKSLIKQQNTLDPQLWDNEKLKPEIVDRLIQIARKFFKSLDIGPDIIIKDITLTGSLASYNWSDYSDVDLHILLDFKQFENPEIIKDLVRNAASNWNNKHDIKMKGYEVEMYVQDANEPHHSLGVYSLSNNRFLKIPQKFTKKIDSEAVKEKANDLMEKIDDIYDSYAEQKYKLAEKRAEYILNKIRNYRRAGLEQDGPYSIENLVFKVLRRNGYIKKIVNLKTNSYDKRMSINYDTRTNLYEAVGYKVPKATMSDLRSLPMRGGIVDAIDYADLRHSRRTTSPKYIVIHHSTSTPARTLNVWTPRGSRKASTHYEIDKDGTIYMYLDPATQRAAHTVGGNKGSIGIDLVGNFKKNPLSKKEAITSPQFRSLQALIGYLTKRFGIPNTVLDKPVDGKKITANQIISNGYGVVGHGHIGYTACPGNLPSYFHLLGKPSTNVITGGNPKAVRGSMKNIIISGNSHMGGAFSAVKNYYNTLSKYTGDYYNLIRIDASQGHGGEVSALNRKINVVANKLKGQPVDTIIHFGTNKSKGVSRLLDKYKKLSNDVIIIGTPESKLNYEFHDSRAKWNEEFKKIIAAMGTGIVYYDTFGRTTQEDLKDNIHLRKNAYTRLFNEVAMALKIDQTRRPKNSGVVSPGGIVVNKWDKKKNDINLPSQESLYTNSIARNSSGGSYGISKNSFLSRFKHLKDKLIPGMYATFDSFYADLDKTFGKRASQLMAIHGRDRIFGPEHFSAAMALAQAKNDKKLEKLLKSKSFKKSDAATKVALKRSLNDSDKVFSTLSGKAVTRDTVRKDVLRAANEMGVDAFTKNLLLKFLEIETAANPAHTFYNPEIAKYRGKVNRPYKIGKIRLIGSFQILQDGEDDYRKYGYDPAQFGDPYHQASVVINFINKVRRKYGDDPTKIYLSWNQGGGGVNIIYNALEKDPDTLVAINKYIPPKIKRNMKRNYRGSKPLTPRNFIERYKKEKGLG